MSTRPSNKLIGKTKDIIATKLFAMSQKIPPDFNEWDAMKAMDFREYASYAFDVSQNERSTMKDLVKCHERLEEFWK